MQPATIPVPMSSAGGCFNPHPARRPDATSTLGCMRVRQPIGFQSSSGLLAGCNRRRYISAQGGYRFNPHPAFWPDATERAGLSTPLIAVSILIRPSGRMQHGEVDDVLQDRRRVSILIRPSGRMQPVVSPACMTPFQFQSSSGLLAGCNLAAYSASVTAFIAFQSSSGLLAGCNQRTRP